MPRHAILLGVNLVEPAHARALDAAKLVDGAALRRLFLEPQMEHAAHHVQACGLVEGELGLPEQAVGPCAAGLPAA